jgi:hypothetical protein
MDMQPIELSDLLPYGFACFEVDGDNVRHPKLFIDPQSGNPHVFATDLSNCLFQIYELVPQIEEEDLVVEKRRRQIIILRKAAMRALRPDLPFAKATLVIGGGLKILMHWDADVDDAIHYLELDEEGESQTKILVLEDGLDHELATELIRELAY